MATDPKEIQELRDYMRRVAEREKLQYQQLQMQQYSNGLLGGTGGGLGGLTLPNFPTLAPIQERRPAPAIDPKAIEALKAAEPRKVTARMPDSVTPITAWRAWALSHEGGEYRLKALGQHTVWEPKKKIEATCVKQTLQSHPAPHFSCECGVWCFKTLEMLLPALEGYTVPIFGNVSIWGKIIETDKGFRAQYAYPKELWLLDKSHEQIGFIYGVPVRSI